MACPRPLSWTLLERMLLIAGLHSVVAIIGMLFLPAEDLPLMIARWVAGGILFAGIGSYATIRSQVMAFGAVVPGMLWIAFFVFGEQLIPVEGTFFFYPFNYVMPYLWSINPFLQPHDLSLSDYWLNRALVMLVGMTFLTLTVYNLRDEERILESVK